MGRPKKKEFLAAKPVICDLDKQTLANDYDKYSHNRFERKFEELSKELNKYSDRLDNLTRSILFKDMDISAGLGLDIEDIQILHRAGYTNEQIEKFTKEEIKGIVPNIKFTFKLYLSNEQIANILPIFNNFISDKELSIIEIKALLNCTNTEVCKVKSNRLLAYLFNRLSKEGYIWEDWQHQFELNKSFASRNGKLLRADDFAKALNQIKDYGEPKHGEIIDNLICELKNIENK
jgi:hypothetical protein